MTYKLFPAPFLKRFIQPSLPPITKLKPLHGVSRGELPPPKKWFNPFVACPAYDNFKTPPPPPTYILFQVL